MSSRIPLPVLLLIKLIVLAAVWGLGARPPPRSAPEDAADAAVLQPGLKASQSMSEWSAPGQRPTVASVFNGAVPCCEP